MTARILAVARMSAWSWIRGRAMFVYFCLLAFPLLSESFRLSASCDAAVWVSGLLALNAVYDETRQRTLAAVLVRPIAAWEYLAGRALALVGLLAGFVLLCVLIGLALPSLAMERLSWHACATTLVRGTAWIAIMVPLGALLKPWTAVWIFAAGKVLGFMADNGADKSSWLAAVKVAFHYGSMCEIATTGAGLQALTLLDNLAYAAIVFVIGVKIFERRDVRLRES